jgi:cardiolipin synthase
VSFLNPLYATITILLEVLGIALAMRAILIARTPQSAIAWAGVLVVLPIVGIPLFLVFGESRFAGYTLASATPSGRLREALQAIVRHLDGYKTTWHGVFNEPARMAENLSGLPTTGSNHVQLLIDGAATFDAIFQSIDAATESIWLQFFIIHDDRLGRTLAEKLIFAARRGVECRVLYDQVGSKNLPASWAKNLRREGIAVEAFVTNRQIGKSFQINFRNHRNSLSPTPASRFLAVSMSVTNTWAGAAALALGATHTFVSRDRPWRDSNFLFWRIGIT